jgi:hypothetical protein
MRDAKIGHLILSGEVSGRESEIVKNCEEENEMAPPSVGNSGAMRVLVDYG